MLQQAQLKALIDRARETLKGGGIIGVMGWRTNQHTAFTLTLPRKKVRFYEPGKTPTSTGNIKLMLLAKNLKHQDADKIHGSIRHNVVLETKEILNILECCKDLTIVPPLISVAKNPHTHKGLGQKQETVASTPPPQDLSLDVYELLTQPTPPRSTTMLDSIQSFTEAFLHEAVENKNKKGYIGRTVLAKMLKEHGIKKDGAHLIKTGWLEGHISEGSSRTGWYKPGPKMLTIEPLGDSANTPPEDPCKYAEWLVAQEPDLLKKRSEILEQLDKVALAKKALEQLSALRATPKA